MLNWTNASDLVLFRSANAVPWQESASVAEVSREEAAILVLRGKRLAALGMRVLVDQCSSSAQQQNTANLRHATQESLVSCIQAYISKRAYPANLSSPCLQGCWLLHVTLPTGLVVGNCITILRCST